MDQEKKMEHAKKRAKDKIEFIQHLLVYLVINAGLLIFNLITSPGTLWVLFPIVGWGIGLTIHFLSTFIFDGLFKNLEEKFVQDELSRP